MKLVQVSENKEEDVSEHENNTSNEIESENFYNGFVTDSQEMYNKERIQPKNHEINC